MESLFSGDLKQKRTILRSIARPIDKMTVSDICAYAGISRQTFYVHFKSKYDIAYWYLTLAEELYLFEIGRTLTLEAGLNGFFGFLYNERQGLSNAFESNPSKREVRHRIERPVSEFMLTLQNNGMELSDDDAFCLTFIVESANCLIASWCLHDMDTPPDVIARRLQKCVPSLFVDAAEPPGTHDTSPRL